MPGFMQKQMFSQRTPQAGNCTIFSYYRATKQCRLTGAEVQY